MNISELIKDLQKIPNQNLPVWIQQENHYASVMEIEVEEGKCLKLKVRKENA